MKESHDKNRNEVVDEMSGSWLEVEPILTWIRTIVLWKYFEQCVRQCFQK